MKAHTSGWVMALVTLILDQASKLGLLFASDLVIREPWPLLPFIDLVVVWNQGISYGLFQQHTEWGRWGLVGLSVIASVWLGAWVHTTTRLLLAVSLGLIMGGAVGNAIDRIAYGAVFDFIHFHVGTFSWYVFNIADAAIVAGVAGLMYDSFFKGSVETDAGSAGKMPQFSVNSASTGSTSIPSTRITSADSGRNV